MITEKVIENFNLGEKEAKVYLANLSLGRSRVSEIAKKAQLNRITTYEILKRFKQKGIATSVTYNNITYFQTVSPERIIEKMERQVALSKELLPQLLSLKDQSKTRPNLEYYEGKEGVKAIYEDTLSSKDKIIYNIAHPTNLTNFIDNDFLQNYIKKRVRKKIKVKVLIPEDEAKQKYTKEVKTALREVKIFNNIRYPVPNEIMIYDNKIALLSFSSKIGVVMEDPEIVQSLKSIWQVLWDSAK